MNKERLSELDLKKINRELARQISYEAVIDDFALKKAVLGLIIGNMHCAQVVLQTKLNYNFDITSMDRYVSKYVNIFELYEI